MSRSKWRGNWHKNLSFSWPKINPNLTVSFIKCKWTWLDSKKFTFVPLFTFTHFYSDWLEDKTCQASHTVFQVQSMHNIIKLSSPFFYAFMAVKHVWGQLKDRRFLSNKYCSRHLGLPVVPPIRQEVYLKKFKIGDWFPLNNFIKMNIWVFSWLPSLFLAKLGDFLLCWWFHNWASYSFSPVLYFLKKDIHTP